MPRMTDLYWLVYRRRLVDGPLLRITSDLLRRDLDPGSSQELADKHVEDLIRKYLRSTDPAFRQPSSAEELAAWWQEQPILSRKDLQVAHHSTGGTRTIRTGGSTGEPVGVQLTRDSFRAKRSRLLASRMAIGWSPGMPTVSIWGSDADLGIAVSRSERLKSAVSRMHIDGGFRGDAERWHRLADKLEGFREPIALYGYTSLLEDFAHTLAGDGRSLRSGCVAVAWNGAEPVTAAARTAVQRVTGVPLHNFYGAREVGAMAVQLDTTAEELTVVLPQLLVEIVDGDGRRVPEGTAGRVVVTTLTDAGGTDLRRYAIGDEAIAGETFMFGHRTLRSITGRSNDNIRLSDGSIVSSSFFLHAAKDFDSFREFQVHANLGLRKIRVAVVVVSERRRALTQIAEFRDRIAPRFAGFEVEVAAVDALPRQRSGKLRQVVVEQ